jgi:hypothetical protein
MRAGGPVGTHRPRPLLPMRGGGPVGTHRPRSGRGARIVEVVHMATSGPSTRVPTTFLLSGPIEAIQCVTRCLRIASNDLEVIGAIQLERFRVGERVVVYAVRDLVTDRMQLLGMVRGSALFSPAVRRSVQNVLHTAVRIMRSRSALAESRARIRERRVSVTTNPPGTWTGLRCVRFERPFSREESVEVKGAAWKHLRPSGLAMPLPDPVRLIGPLRRSPTGADTRRGPTLPASTRLVLPPEMLRRRFGGRGIAGCARGTSSGRPPRAQQS